MASSPDERVVKQVAGEEHVVDGYLRRDSCKTDEQTRYGCGLVCFQLNPKLVRSVGLVVNDFEKLCALEVF